MVQLSHPNMTTGKIIALTRWIFVSKVMSLLFNMLSRLVIAFLPRSKQASFNFMAAVPIYSDFGAPKTKSITVFIFTPSICHEVVGPDTMMLGFWMLSFKPAFSLLFHFHQRRLFSSSSLSSLRVVSSAYLRLLIKPLRLPIAYAVRPNTLSEIQESLLWPYFCMPPSSSLMTVGNCFTFASLIIQLNWFGISSI